MDKLPWIEKYRPKKMSDIVSQNQIIQMIQSQIKYNDFPNICLYGPPGTGKTSVILNITYRLFSPSIYKDRVLKLNASDERGIKVVRGKIREFAQKKTSDDSKCIFKIIILDEADAMTDESQYALRRIMEQYSSNTRFCIICNYINRIIQPLISRCTCLRFKSLLNTDIKELCVSILGNESISYQDKDLENLISNSNGDLRKTITNLQKVSRLFGIIDEKSNEMAFETLKIEFVEDLISRIQMVEIKNLFGIAKEVYHDSYGVQEIIKAMYHYSVEKSFNNSAKSQFILLLMDCDSTLMNNGDEFLQLLRIVIFIKQSISPLNIDFRNMKVFIS